MTNSIARPNGFRTQRKKSGLTQEELAFLLGLRLRSDVSRFEWSRRVPSLEVVIAYEVIFQTLISDLLDEEYDRIDWRVRTRAGKLIEQLGKLPYKGITKRKCEFLGALVRSPRSTNHPVR